MKPYNHTIILLDSDRVIIDRKDVSKFTWDEYKEWRNHPDYYIYTDDRPRLNIGDQVRFQDNWWSYWCRHYSAAIHEFNPMLWDHIHTLCDGWKQWGDENGVEVILDIDGLTRPPREGSYGGATVDWKITFKNCFCDQTVGFKSLVWDRRHDRGLCLRPAGETEYYASGLHHQWDKRVKYRSIQDLEEVIRDRIKEWRLPIVSETVKSMESK